MATSECPSSSTSSELSSNIFLSSDSMHGNSIDTSMSENNELYYVQRTAEYMPSTNKIESMSLTDGIQPLSTGFGFTFQLQS